MTEGIRIGRIWVEGFKGFTGAQEIDLRNRHMFLIGPNGNGKSSIIEAIRWGLFGSTSRRDTVKNEGYAGDCRVEINLARDGKRWNLRRILNPGGGGSRPTLFDEDGGEHTLRNVLPQLDSLDAGEGTHIIFSSQSAPLRRQPEDLTAFERTVFDHLGLKHPRAMLSHLETFLKDQEDAEDSLDGLVGDARRRIDLQITDLEGRRRRIFDSPPWDSDLQPSRQDTKRKAQNLIRKIETAEPRKDVSGFSLGALVDEAELALEKRTGWDREPLDRKLSSLNDQLSRLESMQDVHGELVHRKQKLREAGERLEVVLDGASIDELQERVQRERQRAQTRDLKHRLVEIATELLNRTEVAATLCPICGEEREEGELEQALSTMVRVGSEVGGSGRHSVEDQVNTAQEIASDVQELSRGIAKLQSDLDAMIDAEDDDELAKAVGEGRVSEYVESVTERKTSIAKQIDDLDNWLAGVQKELRKLREEADYQQIQRDLIRMKAVDAEMHRVQRAYDQLVNFGQCARDIRNSVESTLMKALREKTPSVAEDLTSVFSALTRHPHFDRLVIDERKLPKLELCVASRSDSSGKRHPTSVLNGQAQSALALVPYFALSQAAETPTEVHLVLLDDPTRAFDREHIQILIEQLADLGERVQVVVATQETEAFCDLLPRSFKRQSYVIVKPESWSYAGGPKLVTQYG